MIVAQFWITFIVILTNNPQFANADSRIILGLPSLIQNFPYQAAVLAAKDDLYCGGTILNENMILTAAHCTK